MWGRQGFKAIVNNSCSTPNCLAFNFFPSIQPIYPPSTRPFQSAMAAAPHGRAVSRVPLWRAQSVRRGDARAHASLAGQTDARREGCARARLNDCCLALSLLNGWSGLRSDLLSVNYYLFTRAFTYIALGSFPPFHPAAIPFFLRSPAHGQVPGESARDEGAVGARVERRRQRIRRRQATQVKRTDVRKRGVVGPQCEKNRPDPVLCRNNIFV